MSIAVNNYIISTMERNEIMSNINSLDTTAQEYFYSLPMSVQEQIIQSNIHITCQEDIERYFNNILRPSDKTNMNL